MTCLEPEKIDYMMYKLIYCRPGPSLKTHFSEEVPQSQNISPDTQKDVLSPDNVIFLIHVRDIV